MQVASLDHLVLTVADVEASANFYKRVLGMQRVMFGEGRTALQFGNQKINLHRAIAPLQPHALHPVAGGAYRGVGSDDIAVFPRSGWQSD